MIPANARNFRPGRIWSLWDMYALHAQHFVMAINALVQLNEIAARDPNWVISDQSKREHLIKMMDVLKTELANLQLPMAIKQADKMRISIENLHSKYPPQTLASRLSTNLEELKSRIEDELEGRVVYCLSPSEADYAISTEPPFGQDVSDKFTKSTFDLEEARKCLAFGRWTASVFHLMRAMEEAVMALSKKLGMTNVDREWGKLLSDMKPRIEALPLGPDRDLWSESHSLLYHVKQAWRNNTMHPKETYTEEEASAVYSAVKSFTRHLVPLV